MNKTRIAILAFFAVLVVLGTGWYLLVWLPRIEKQLVRELLAEFRKMGPIKGEPDYEKIEGLLLRCDLV